MAIQQSINNAIGSFAALGVIGKHFNNQDQLKAEKIDAQMEDAAEGVKNINSLSEAGSDEQIKGVEDYINNLSDDGKLGTQKYAQMLTDPYKQKIAAMQAGEDYGKSQHEMKTYTSLLHQFLEEHPSGGAR